MATAGPIDMRARFRQSAPPVRADLAAFGHTRRRRIATFVAFGVAVLVIWELVKWLGGVPWRFGNVLGTGLSIDHNPPFRWGFASDLNLPHWFSILGSLAAPVQRNADESLGQFLAGAAPSRDPARMSIGPAVAMG